MNTEINIWSAIKFDSNWEITNTSIFDDLKPSWDRKSEEFKISDKAYQGFLDTLKRQHAIETWVVEKLYNLSDWVTETLIKNWFIESYVSHDSTDISPTKLMWHLNDHLGAIEEIFKLVKEDRKLSKSFIKQLHQLLTKNQDTTEAIDPFWRRINIELLKWEFKRFDNNPRRSDWTIYKYCPPIHVESEIEQLVNIYNTLEDTINPIILAAWIHHAFTQIHPFQDWNWRLARLLATLVLIKKGLLPFTVKREKKTEYLDALEQADKWNPQLLVDFFAKAQKHSIENAINYQEIWNHDDLYELADILNEKISSKIANENSEKIKEQKLFTTNLFKEVTNSLETIKLSLHSKIAITKVQIWMKPIELESKDYYYYNHQIIHFAKSYNYFFNKDLARSWGKLYFSLYNWSTYNLIVSIHNYWYGWDTLAIWCFLEYTKKINEKEIETEYIQINLSPYTISISNQLNEKNIKNITNYLEDAVKIALAIVIKEID